MTKEEFNQLLKVAKLSKKDLSLLVDLNLGTVHNWGSGQKFPRWVRSWLINYIDAQHFRNLKESINEMESIN